LNKIWYAGAKLDADDYEIETGSRIPIWRTSVFRKLK